MGRLATKRPSVVSNARKWPGWPAPCPACVAYKRGSNGSASIRFNRSGSTSIRTGTTTVPSAPVISTASLYTPWASPAVRRPSRTVPAVVPDAGSTFSHEPPVARAVHGKPAPPTWMSRGRASWPTKPVAWTWSGDISRAEVAKDHAFPRRTAPS